MINKQYEKKELGDGVLYSIDGKEYKSDIVIGKYVSDFTNDGIITIKSKDTNSYYSYNNRTVGLMFITPQDIESDD